MCQISVSIQIPPIRRSKPNTTLSITNTQADQTVDIIRDTETPPDKESSIVTDSMTGYHALGLSPDVHRRTSASKWTHRQTLAQTGCSRTDCTLFWLFQASAAARKLTLRTDLKSASFPVSKAMVTVYKRCFPSFKCDTNLDQERALLPGTDPPRKHCTAGFVLPSTNSTYKVLQVRQLMLQ